MPDHAGAHDRMADDRVVAALELAGEAVAVAPADVESGSPVTTTTPLVVTDGPSEVGIWTLEGGSYRDVEVDEVFVVLSGRALLTIDGQPPRDISTGDFVRLHAGERTVWAVETSLRKLYVAPAG